MLRTDVCLDLSTNTGLKELHVWDINLCSYARLEAVLRSIPRPANLGSLSIYMTLGPSGELPMTESYWRGSLNGILRSAFATLASLNIWLRPPGEKAADYSVEPMELVDLVRSWMSEEAHDTLVWVRPWYTLLIPPPCPSSQETSADSDPPSLSSHSDLDTHGARCSCITAPCQHQ